MAQPASKRVVTEGNLADPAHPAGQVLLGAIDSEVAPVAGRVGRQNVFHVVGDSLSANGVGAVGRPAFADARNPWGWATLASNGKLQLGTIAATGGFTSSQILATHLPTALAAARPGDRIVVLAGTNDTNITGGINGTLCRANLLSMYQQIRDAGCFPVGCSIPPVGYAFGTGAVTGAETAAAAGTRLALSSWIETTMRRNGWEFLDYYSVVTNPLATGSVFEGSLAQDTIHPNEAGGKALGTYIATQLTRQDTPVSRLAAHRIASGDGYLFGNATMGDTNADGIPDQFTSTASAGTTTPFAIITDAGCVGKMFQVTRDAAATSNTLAQTASVTVVPGNRYFLGFKVKATVTTPSSTSTVVAQLYSGATYLAGITITGFNQSIPLGQFSTEFVMPAGITSVNFQMQARTGATTIAVGQLTFYDLTALGF